MATATHHQFLDMRVTDVRRVRDSARDHIIVLAEPDGPRRLPIWIGRDEARPIAVRLLGARLQRPLAHDLAVRLVQALGGSLREVRIDRLADQTFYAAVVLDGPTGSAEVDARPSDALTLALAAGAPIRVDRGLLEAVEASGFVSSSLAAMGSQDQAGPHAILLEHRPPPGNPHDPSPTS
ncbi:MAG TPA: bifunctional nuclease family protein [Actinomycetes bacterium]|jgi:bifunctional DNase/RNase|nr:bifunctional nuclease family protein [Actinomycetes bacterium]